MLVWVRATERKMKTGMEESTQCPKLHAEPPNPDRTQASDRIKARRLQHTLNSIWRNGWGKKRFWDRALKGLWLSSSPWCLWPTPCAHHQYCSLPKAMASDSSKKQWTDRKKLLVAALVCILSPAVRKWCIMPDRGETLESFVRWCWDKLDCVS